MKTATLNLKRLRKTFSLEIWCLTYILCVPLQYYLLVFSFLHNIFVVFIAYPYLSCHYPMNTAPSGSSVVQEDHRVIFNEFGVVHLFHTSLNQWVPEEITIIGKWSGWFNPNPNLLKSVRPIAQDKDVVKWQNQCYCTFVIKVLV